MLPTISLALSVEMLRDGGSLCAAFQGTNGSVYWLVLPVQFESGVVKGYSNPVVVERPFAAEEIQVSWSHAEVLLHQIEHLLPPSANRSWVQPMYEVIHNEGKRCA
jgi:hypothetical protein